MKNQSAEWQMPLAFENDENVKRKILARI